MEFLQRYEHCFRPAMQRWEATSNDLEYLFPNLQLILLQGEQSIREQARWPVVHSSNGKPTTKHPSWRDNYTSIETRTECKIKIIKPTSIRQLLHGVGSMGSDRYTSLLGLRFDTHGRSLYAVHDCVREIIIGKNGKWVNESEDECSLGGERFLRCLAVDLASKPAKKENSLTLHIEGASCDLHAVDQFQSISKLVTWLSAYMPHRLATQWMWNFSVDLNDVNMVKSLLREVSSAHFVLLAPHKTG